MKEHCYVVCSKSMKIKQDFFLIQEQIKNLKSKKKKHCTNQD
jgi:hypothetical protein